MSIYRRSISVNFGSWHGDDEFFYGLPSTTTELERAREGANPGSWVTGIEHPRSPRRQSTEKIAANLAQDATAPTVAPREPLASTGSLGLSPTALHRAVATADFKPSSPGTTGASQPSHDIPDPASPYHNQPATLRREYDAYVAPAWREVRKRWRLADKRDRRGDGAPRLVYNAAGRPVLTQAAGEEWAESQRRMQAWIWGGPRNGGTG